MRRIFGAVALGAALTYFFDPTYGAERRRQAREWLASAAERAAGLVTRALGEPPEVEAAPTSDAGLRETRTPPKEPAPERAVGPLPPAAFVAGAPAETPEPEPEPEPFESEPEPVAEGTRDRHPEPEITIREAGPAPVLGEWTLDPSPGEDEELERAAREAEPVTRASGSRRTFPLVLAALAATAAATAAGLGVWALADTSDASTEAATTARLQDQERAIAVLSQRDSTRIPVQGSNGRIVLVVAPTGEAVLVIQNVRPAPKGKTYEAWVIVGKTPAPAGLFGARSGTTVIPLTRPVPKGAIVAVTLEKAGGTASPTTMPIYTAKRAA